MLGVSCMMQVNSFLVPELLHVCCPKWAACLGPPVLTTTTAWLRNSGYHILYARLTFSTQNRFGTKQQTQMAFIQCDHFLAHQTVMIFMWKCTGRKLHTALRYEGERRERKMWEGDGFWNKRTERLLGISTILHACSFSSVEDELFRGCKEVGGGTLWVSKQISSPASLQKRWKRFTPARQATIKKMHILYIDSALRLLGVGGRAACWSWAA